MGGHRTKGCHGANASRCFVLRQAQKMTLMEAEKDLGTTVCLLLAFCQKKLFTR